ncbi:MAG: helix-turn-helix transcriptional regulator [Gammaproteobacteria bacterium]|nr:helix-turn-helix transcriptional regulator [Gammaproteobacteria bacterium]
MSKRNPHDKQREILRKILINARKNNGITQIQLATQLNKPQSFVSKYENGDRLIDLVETHQICQALNQSFTELTGSFDSEINELSANYHSDLKIHNHEY